MEPIILKCNNCGHTARFTIDDIIEQGITACPSCRSTNIQYLQPPANQPAAAPAEKATISQWALAILAYLTPFLVIVLLSLLFSPKIRVSVLSHLDTWAYLLFAAAAGYLVAKLVIFWRRKNEDKGKEIRHEYMLSDAHGSDFPTSARLHDTMGGVGSWEVMQEHKWQKLHRRWIIGALLLPLFIGLAMARSTHWLILLAGIPLSAFTYIALHKFETCGFVSEDTIRQNAQNFRLGLSKIARNKSALWTIMVLLWDSLYPLLAVWLVVFYFQYHIWLVSPADIFGNLFYIGGILFSTLALLQQVYGE